MRVFSDESDSMGDSETKLKAFSQLTLEDMDRDSLELFFRVHRELITEELERLQSDIYTNLFSDKDFKNLRLFLLENFQSKQKGSLTLNFLKLLFLIYINKDDKYKTLHHLIYFNTNQSIVMGIERNLGLELYLESKRTPRASKRGTSKEGHSIQSDYSRNKFVFPFNLSAVSVSSTTNLSDIFNRFIQQYQSNEKVFNRVLFRDPLQDSPLLVFSKKNSRIILEYFQKLLCPVKNIMIQENEDEQIENLYTMEEYLEKYSNQKELLNLNDIPISNLDSEGALEKLYEKYEDYLIPEEVLKMNNLHTMINKRISSDFKFLLSPLVKKNKLDSYNKEIIIRTKIKIIRNEYLDLNEVERMVTKLTYICPECDVKVLMNANEMNKEISHVCDPTTNKKTRVKEAAVEPEIQTPVFLYNCEVCSNYDEVLNFGAEEEYLKNVYIYSFENALEAGFHLCDVVTFFGNVNVLKKDRRNFMYLILGNKKMKIDYQNGKVIRDSQEIKDVLKDESISEKKKRQFEHLENVIYKKNKLPRMKLWEIIFSARQYYQDRFNIPVNDSGLLLQVFAAISVIARECFCENKIAISVMGVGSVAKTFPCNMMFNLLCTNYLYISDTARMTVAGMTGGMNASAYINGAIVKKFEQGVVSFNGVVTLDECQSVFLNSDMQSIIKSIPQDDYQVMTVGGRSTEFNCTPVLLSNFNQFMKVYEKNIVDAYLVKYKTMYKYENDRKLKNNQDIVRYVSKVNLYQNIEYYYDVMQDEILANVIFAVRKKFEDERIDWKTGSQIEAMNRILFDVVIHRKLSSVDVEIPEHLTGKANTKDVKLKENMPTQQAVQEILKMIYKNNDVENIKKINLKDEFKNSERVRKQLEMLDEKIMEYLVKDEMGVKITKYFTQNVDNFDKKILEIVKKVIKILQLTEDCNSVELSENVKVFANILMLKCKRGLIQEEYDFEVNVREIKTYPKLNSEYLVDLEDVKTELYYEQKIEKEKKILEEKFKNQDDSMKALSVEIEMASDESLKMEEMNKEYNLLEICKRMNFVSEDESEMLNFVKMCKRNGTVYESRSGVYKVDVK